MPESLDHGTAQVMPKATLVWLGPFLRQYCRQHQLTLLPEALPGADSSADRFADGFWCLLGPTLSLVVSTRTINADNQPSPQADQTVAVSLITEVAAVADSLAQRSLAHGDLAPTDIAALGQFMLAWVRAGAEASANLDEHQSVIDRQHDRRLLLNQVITKIQGSLELAEILATTVAEVRQFLQADRLLIYQFDPAPSATVKPLDGGESQNLAEADLSHRKSATVGYITYESRSSDRLASVLNYTEGLCFEHHADAPHRGTRYRQGETVAIDDVATVYQHAPCMTTFLTQMQVKSKAVAPIFVGQQLWGLLIVHQCEYHRPWQPWETELLQQIAEHLAIAIHQAQLYHQLQGQTKNLEVCVIERTQDLRDALVAAEAANRAKSEFLATMSHELRTPLTYIIGMSATLLRWSLGELSPRQRDYLTTIQASGEQLLRIINDILDVSKIEAGRTTLEVRPFSLTSLCRQSVDAFRDEAAHNNIEIAINLKLVNGQDTFVADLRRVRQILANLLSNAVKFTPAEGQVTLQVRREQNDAVFQVKDTGIGIAAAAQSLLFEKFQQLENVRQREHQGTGLGLALTKQLVELHGGSIKVSSEVGVGSVFTVRIPQQRAAALAAPEPPATLEPTVGRIVLVEDNEEAASLICDLLTAAAYQVIWVVDGSRLIDQIKLLRPAAVITSLTLTSDNDILAVLHQALGPIRPKILALLDGEDHHRVAQALEAGASGCIAKPIDPKQLLSTVNAAMVAQPV
ncbi:MAG: hybrid sensor histidine kinase/response regulator [Shackletoniella antarctica]|uniref:Circadian input-output histidine kinase CikA n=1 Tax=Shackletoniella antarctica TaxID=268115 RepID=A0A2W4XG60_9CYAN|nr:MAG: hybrid sensor histidine kinase/response regulator [Shackletoniella antarctica]